MRYISEATNESRFKHSGRRKIISNSAFDLLFTNKTHALLSLIKINRAFNPFLIALKHAIPISCASPPVLRLIIPLILILHQAEDER